MAGRDCFYLTNKDKKLYRLKNNRLKEETMVFIKTTTDR